MLSTAARLRRPLCPVLAVATLLVGCAGPEVNEHRARGAPESITLRATWADPDGEPRLVGGVRCRILRGWDAVAEGTTDGQAPLRFEGLAPGRYAVEVGGPGVEPQRVEVELRPRRRLTVRVDVTAAGAEERGAAGGGSAAAALGEGALFVLKVVGVTVAVVALVGLVVLALAVTDEGEGDGEGGDAPDADRR